MLLVAALYIAYALLLRSSGRGLGPGWLLTLCLPGALAAHLCWLRGKEDSSGTEGVLSGLVTATFASVLQACVLLIAVLNVDWTRYAAQVGPEIVGGVREAAIPIAVILAIVTAAVTYAGCILAAWFGSLAYIATRKTLKRLS